MDVRMNDCERTDVVYFSSVLSAREPLVAFIPVIVVDDFFGAVAIFATNAAAVSHRNR